MLYKLPNTETTAQAVILANGNFPTHLIPLSILYNNRDKIICCDGAINSLIQTDIIPYAIVGDCDSLSEQNKIRFADKIHQIHEQDTNDLTKAISFCREQSIQQIIILGATGKREDHTIANISLLADYIDFIVDINIITDYGVFNAIKADSNFESFKGQQISLFGLNNTTAITSKNLKYSINQLIFNKWWEATLNESLSDSFNIKVNDKIIVYRVF